MDTSHGHAIPLYIFAIIWSKVGVFGAKIHHLKSAIGDAKLQVIFGGCKKN